MHTSSASRIPFVSSFPASKVYVGSMLLFYETLVPDVDDLSYTQITMTT